MLNEVDNVRENAKKVKRNGIPINIPMYLFIAKNNNIMPNWKEILSKYAAETKYGKYKLLDSGHYIHHEKSDILAQEAKAFLKEIYSD